MYSNRSVASLYLWTQIPCPLVQIRFRRRNSLAPTAPTGIPNGQNSRFQILNHVAAPNFPVMSNRPSLPYQHIAYRKIGLQKIRSCQVCRPWCRLHALLQVCRNICVCGVLCVCTDPTNVEVDSNPLPGWLSANTDRSIMRKGRSTCRIRAKREDQRPRFKPMLIDFAEALSLQRWFLQQSWSGLSQCDYRYLVVLPSKSVHLKTMRRNSRSQAVLYSQPASANKNIKTAANCKDRRCMTFAATLCF
jgi:hypothetical protein